MNCQNAQKLVPGYLDGEISEAQAAPLRQHLLSCAACRALAQGGKSLSEWFVEDAPIAVPKGFATRVARRAFAGDTGERAWAQQASAAGDGTPLLSFVLHMTAIAAALLIALSIGVRTLGLPATGELRADDASKDWALEELDRLNDEDEQPGAAATDAKGARDDAE